jgi:hypothetical protein
MQGSYSVQFTGWLAGLHDILQQSCCIHILNCADIDGKCAGGRAWFIIDSDISWIGLCHSGSIVLILFLYSFEDAQIALET